MKRKKQIRRWILLNRGAFATVFDSSLPPLGMVVRAENRTKARRLAARSAGREGRKFWIDPKKTKCLRLVGCQLGTEPAIPTA